jgi:hypothetical protein
VESLKGMATGAVEAVRNPRMVAEMLKQTAQRATSGPLGLGEVVGENVNMVRMPGKPVMHELDVYHGTPHRFEPTEANPLGEFDASKIGTGEGAQSYGHGVYLAQAPSVAQNFRPKDQSIGGLYKADLPDEMIDRMLDWDKPLSQQPEIYKKVLGDKGWRKRLENRSDTQVGEMTGEELYRMGHDQTARLGIPGIKYSDASSRGTSNFVVFPGEEKKVRILERK